MIFVCYCYDDVSEKVYDMCTDDECEGFERRCRENWGDSMLVNCHDE